jgi:hypothetical protein
MLNHRSSTRTKSKANFFPDGRRELAITYHVHDGIVNEVAEQ